MAAPGGRYETFYPTRPIRIVVPATTGGAIDLIARSLAEKMSSSLAQPAIEIQGGTPGEFGDVIKAEIDKWGRSVKEAGIQPE
jgi:tripartite-type tricarboxylate transporter receptor subunit TctC